jgi:hypothetical protein
MGALESTEAERTATKHGEEKRMKRTRRPADRNPERAPEHRHGEVNAGSGFRNAERRGARRGRLGSVLRIGIVSERVDERARPALPRVRLCEVAEEPQRQVVRRRVTERMFILWGALTVEASSGEGPQCRPLAQVRLYGVYWKIQSPLSRSLARTYF